MKDLIEDIRKKEFQKVYLLCGEEPYLRQLYKKKLTEAVLPEGDTMNLSVYTGKNVDPKAVIDQAETMPFFADKRLILLEDTGFFNCRSRKTVPGFAWFRVVNVFSANIRTVGFSSLSAAFGVSCSNKAVRHSWGRAGWRTLFVMRCDFPKFNVIFAPVFLKGCLTVRLRLYPLYRIRVMPRPGDA